jgi:hypothetical protein
MGTRQHQCGRGWADQPARGLDKPAAQQSFVGRGALKQQKYQVAHVSTNVTGSGQTNLHNQSNNQCYICSNEIHGNTHASLSPNITWFDCL